MFMHSFVMVRIVRQHSFHLFMEKGGIGYDVQEYTCPSSQSVFLGFAAKAFPSV